jgi:hypothetical protein
MIIDKNKFKEYINDKLSESIHINEIKSISINNMKYHKDQLSKDSKYHEVVEKNGFVDLVMIKPIWIGWKVVNENNTRKELIGTWAYRDNRTNSSNYCSGSSSGYFSCGYKRRFPKTQITSSPSPWRSSNTQEAC